ncbi:MAG: SH3 domain-containing protein [Spirochaetales bacterium]|nr:SH3 domain-containing protein [Spirochaetales bacterium]
MEITQSSRTRNIKHRRLVIICLFFLFFFQQNLFPEKALKREIISYENAGNLPPLYKEEIEIQKSQDLYKNPFIYFCFLPGIIVFILLFLFKKRKTSSHLFLFFILLSLCLGAKGNSPDVIEEGIHYFERGEYNDALKVFKQAEVFWGPLKGLCYNNALCYYHLEKKGYAVFELYRAIKKDPLKKRFLQTLALIEKEYELSSQVNPAPFIHPDIPFICLLVLFNSTCILLGLGFRFKKGSIVIVFVLFTLCTIGAAALFIATQFQLQEKICVVISRNGILKQIPLPSSRTWVLLKEGTSVKVLGSAKGYYLIKTGRGLKGWIREADVKVE